MYTQNNFHIPRIAKRDLALNTGWKLVSVTMIPLPVCDSLPHQYKLYDVTPLLMKTVYRRILRGSLYL